MYEVLLTTMKRDVERLVTRYYARALGLVVGIQWTMGCWRSHPQPLLLARATQQQRWRCLRRCP
jgi:hypothetical protein